MPRQHLEQGGHYGAPFLLPTCQCRQRCERRPAASLPELATESGGMSARGRRCTHGRSGSRTKLTEPSWRACNPDSWLIFLMRASWPEPRTRKCSIESIKGMRNSKQPLAWVRIVLEAQQQSRSIKCKSSRRSSQENCGSWNASARKGQSQGSGEALQSSRGHGEGG